MRRHFNIVVIVCAITLASCCNSSRNECFANKSFEDISSDEDTEYLYAEAEAELVTCPICNGLGYYQFSSDDIMAPTYQCCACNGSGKCNVETAQQAIQSQAQFEAIINGMGITNGCEYCGNSRSASQIEYQLQKANELLESMEENYANCEGFVVSAQYPHMIAKQKERILELESELRNAY